jgi:hypothetical protein
LPSVWAPQKFLVEFNVAVSEPNATPLIALIIFLECVWIYAPTHGHTNARSHQRTVTPTHGHDHTNRSGTTLVQVMCQMVFKDMLFKSWGDRTVHSPSDTFISEIEQFTDTCIKGRIDLAWVR